MKVREEQRKEELIMEREGKRRKEVKMVKNGDCGKKTTSFI